MKNVLLLAALLLPLAIYSQKPVRMQVQIDSKFLEVNQDATKELGFTFSAGLGFATRSNANKEDRVPMPAPRVSIGVELEPWYGIFLHPQLSWFQNGSLEIGPDWKSRLRVNNIGLDLEIQPRLLKAGPWSYGFIFDPFFSYATCGKQYFKYGGVEDKWNLEFPDEYFRIEGHVGLGLGATVATDLGDFTFRARYNLSYTPIYLDLKSLRDRSLEIGITGKLFRDPDRARQRKELIYLLTPRLVDPE